MENILDLLINFGFPIALSMFLLLSFQKTLKELTDATNEMKQTLKDIITKVSFQVEALDKDIDNISQKVEGLKNIQIKLEEICNKKL